MTDFVKLTTSYEGLLETLKPFLPSFHGFDPESWQEGSKNMSLTDKRGRDFALFEDEGDGVFFSHIFCSERRGREAILFGKQAVSDMIDKYGALVLRGLTPLTNKPALFVARKIGFKAFGTCLTPHGEQQIFILTKDDWSTMNG